MINLLHIPEGVRDIYGPECINKAEFESRIKSCLHQYGYSDVVTPSFEYFDIFNKERGSMSSRDMYKFFDKDGNTLVLRPDITPPMARVTAKYFKDCILPVRLCYRAKQYINHSSLQGKLKETTQLGAELYNDASVHADLEIILMTIKSLLACGVKDFQLEIGIAGFLGGIIEESGLSEENVEQLKVKELLEQKNIFGLENFASACKAPYEIKALIGRLAELYGDAKLLDDVSGLLLPEKSRAALERLNKLNLLLHSAGYDKYVSYDLSMLSKYSYYTGVFFRAITYGSGEPVAYGGRYDGLVKQFGYDVPAIGVSITLDYLMMGLEREGLLPETKKNTIVVFFTDDQADEAYLYAESLRNETENNVRLVRDNDGSLKTRLEEILIDPKKSPRSELETFDILKIISISEK